MVAVRIAGRAVWIRPWLALHTCPHGCSIPVLLLDTDLEQNAPEDRSLTVYLYGGDDEYRMKQEIVLGIGGYRLLMALGFEIGTYHLNEGHAALLTLELMNRFRLPPQEWREGEPCHDLGEVRERCVFTTHTPVEAGHDRFDYGLVERLLPEAARLEEIRRLAGQDRLCPVLREMPNSRHSAVIGSPSSRRATKRRRSSMTCSLSTASTPPAAKRRKV